MSEKPKSPVATNRGRSAEPKKSRLAALAPGENIKEKQVGISLVLK